MKNTALIGVSMLALVLAQIACAVSNALSLEPAPTATPEPSSTPLPTRVPSATPTEVVDILFYDDFSQMDNAWIIPRSNYIVGDLHLSAIA